jgi:hypothetical protein
MGLPELVRERRYAITWPLGGYRTPRHVALLRLSRRDSELIRNTRQVCHRSADDRCPSLERTERAKAREVYAQLPAIVSCASSNAAAFRKAPALCRRQRTGPAPIGGRSRGGLPGFSLQSPHFANRMRRTPARPGLSNSRRRLGPSADLPWPAPRFHPFARWGKNPPRLLPKFREARIPRGLTVI